jgi:pilus assembly protein Flp/PilA
MSKRTSRKGFLRRREAGATAVEYALMASLIALVIIGAVTLVGAQLQAIFADAAARV